MTVWHPSLSGIGGLFINATGHTDGDKDGKSSGTGDDTSSSTGFFFLCLVGLDSSILIASGDFDQLQRL